MLVLALSSDTGLIHSTPWRQNTHDVPNGEWPPAPERLLRTISSRFYQYQLETDIDMEALTPLLEKLACAQVSFYLPPRSWRGPSIRQYHLIGLKSQQPDTRLVRDNTWAIDPKDRVLFFLDGIELTPEEITLLDACLIRASYFGRRESLARLKRVADPRPNLMPNCKLEDTRHPGMVPVLCFLPGATRDQMEVQTRDVRGMDIPPGFVYRFAKIPPIPRSVPTLRAAPAYRPTNCVQFSLGYIVKPPVQKLVVITSRFRGRIIRNLVETLYPEWNGRDWDKIPEEVQTALQYITGKDAAGNPLRGFEGMHLAFWYEGERNPSRLIVRKATAFTEQEYQAILRAASWPIPWVYGSNSGSSWAVSFTGLDAAVPLPEEFQSGAHRTWTSMTPYVPPRHACRSNGRMIEGESIPEQVQRELASRGHPGATVTVCGDRQWVGVHRPRDAKARKVIRGDKAGYILTLQFPEPVVGPISLGMSSHFGLGLFTPGQE